MTHEYSALAVDRDIERDTVEPNGHALRQIRNRFGPSWLAAY